MSCREVLPMLSAYSDGELAAEEGRMVKAHLAECTACAHELEATRRMTGMLSSVTEIEPPAFLLAQIEAATIARQPQPGFVERLRAAFAPVWQTPQYARVAGVAAALAVIAVLAARLGLQQPTPAPTVAKSAPAVVAQQPTGAPTATAKPSQADETPRATVRHAYNRRHRGIHNRTAIVAVKPAPAIQVKVQYPTVFEAVSEELDLTDDLQMALLPDSMDEAAMVMAAQEAPPVVAETAPIVDTPSPLVAKLQEGADSFKELRARMAERYARRTFMAWTESLDGPKISMDLASIRF